MNETKCTLILDFEEYDWLDDSDAPGFFDEKIKNITDNINRNTYNSEGNYTNKIDITRENLRILLDEMKRIMKQYQPNDMKKYKQTTDRQKIDEELDGADYRLAESIASKIKKMIN